MKKKMAGYMTIALLGVLLWAAYRIIYIPEQTIPWPYQFAPTMEQPLTEKLYKDRPIDVLIIGDQMAQNLFAFRQLLSNELSSNLQEALNIGLLSGEFDGLHRTLYKLKKLDPLPKIIIYHSGAHEEFEYKFKTEDTKKIIQNFERYQNPYIQTLIKISPKFGQFIYNKVGNITLQEHIEHNTQKLSHHVIQIRSELSFKLFEYEIKELIDYVKEKRSLLILTSTPLNLDIPPKDNCNDSSTKESNATLIEAKRLLEHGDFKSAQTLLEDIRETTPGNATLFYLLGHASKGMGRHAQAVKYLNIASSLDCARWRSNGVFNSIIKTTAKNKNSLLFDFDGMVTSAWYGGITFIDDIYPQDIYYQEAIKTLATQIKTLLKI